MIKSNLIFIHPVRKVTDIERSFSEASELQSVSWSGRVCHGSPRRQSEGRKYIEYMNIKAEILLRLFYLCNRNDIISGRLLLNKDHFFQLSCFFVCRLCTLQNQEKKSFRKKSWQSAVKKIDRVSTVQIKSNRVLAKLNPALCKIWMNSTVIRGKLLQNLANVYKHFISRNCRQQLLVSVLVTMATTSTSRKMVKILSANVG